MKKPEKKPRSGTLPRQLAALGLSLFAAGGLIFVPLSFVLGQSLFVPALDRVLQLRVDPRFSGGEVRTELLDAVGDEKGAGNLSYPLHESWKGSGYLDIVSYTVFEPLTDPAWADPPAFWQVGIEFAAMSDAMVYGTGFSHPAARIYIDLDGEASGSTEGVDPRGELVGFDPAHPWDIAVTFDGSRKDARLRSADGKLDERIPMIVVPERRSIFVRIPLDRPVLSRVLDGRKTWHYVMAGAFSPYAGGNLMPVKEEAEASSGGGSASPLTPKVYDCILPPGKDQGAILSSFDEASWTEAAVYPVESDPPPAGPAGRRKAAELPSAAIAKAKAEMAAAAKESSATARKVALAGMESSDPLVKAVALFELERFEEARKAFAAILSAQADEAEALAYAGSLKAMEGGKAKNPAEAMRIVQEAIGLLDRAVELARRLDSTSPGKASRQALVAALMNRASVLSGVPEEVFRTSAAAALDFLELAGLTENADGGKAFFADRILDAGLCLEKAQDGPGARLLFLRRRSLGGLDARARYELLKRGLMPTAEP